MKKALLRQDLYSHGAVVADVAVVLAAWAWGALALLEAAAHFVSRGPDQLRVVAHILQRVAARPVREVVSFQEPRLYCEKPGLKLIKLVNFIH